MREEIEERLKKLEEHVLAIRSMLEKVLNIQPAIAVPKSPVEIMTVKQVAELIRVDTGMIYSRCARGEIPHFKIGNQFRVKKDEIMEWIKSQKAQPAFGVNEYVSKYMQKHTMRM